MTTTAVIILVALGLATLIGLVVAAARRSTAKRRAALQAVAQQSGWSFAAGTVEPGAPASIKARSPRPSPTSVRRGWRCLRSPSDENLLHKVGGALGYHDIDFDSVPEFSKKYLLRSKQGRIACATSLLRRCAPTSSSERR